MRQLNSKVQAQKQVALLQARIARAKAELATVRAILKSFTAAERAKKKPGYSARNAMLFQRWYDGETLREVGAWAELSPGRIRQLVQQHLHKLISAKYNLQRRWWQWLYHPEGEQECAACAEYDQIEQQHTENLKRRRAQHKASSHDHQSI